MFFCGSNTHKSRVTIFPFIFVEFFCWEQHKTLKLSVNTILYVIVFQFWFFFFEWYKECYILIFVFSQTLKPIFKPLCQFLDYKLLVIIRTIKSPQEPIVVCHILDCRYYLWAASFPFSLSNDIESGFYSSLIFIGLSIKFFFAYMIFLLFLIRFFLSFSIKEMIPFFS